MRQPCSKRAPAKQRRCNGEAEPLHLPFTAECKADRGNARRRQHQHQCLGHGCQGQPPVVAAAALVEINCETDFVSKNDDFLAFAQALADLVAANHPADVAALAALPLAQAGFGPSVEDVRKGLIGKIGENITVRRFKRYAGGGKLARYLHGTRIGVLVEYDGDEVAAKDVAMHVAAMKPAALSAAAVPAELVEKERRIAAEKAAESGKPAEIVAKMVEGSVQKYLKEISLVDQVFVKAADGKQSVGAMLADTQTTVRGFTLYVVGEGIEKRSDDFAAEVAAQVAAAKAQ